MSSALAPDTFIPFEPLPPAAPVDPGGPRLKVMPRADGPARPDFSPLTGLAQPPGPGASGAPGSHAHSTPGAAPVVTLQRDGDRVTGIRIECGCGQVIELACSA